MEANCLSPGAPERDWFNVLKSLASWSKYWPVKSLVIPRQNATVLSFLPAHVRNNGWQYFVWPWHRNKMKQVTQLPPASLGEKAVLSPAVPENQTHNKRHQSASNNVKHLGPKGRICLKPRVWPIFVWLSGPQVWLCQMSNDVKCEYTAIAVRVAGAMSKKKNLVCYSFLIRHRDNCASSYTRGWCSGTCTYMVPRIQQILTQTKWSRFAANPPPLWSATPVIWYIYIRNCIICPERFGTNYKKSHKNKQAFVSKRLHSTHFHSAKCFKISTIQNDMMSQTHG